MLKHPGALTVYEELSAMCIYCNTSNYRKIYEHHHGPILKEPNGRAYEVHHIDGNHSNNNPANLTLLTIAEHLQAHLDNNDWGGAQAVKMRMNCSPQEISEFARQMQLKLVAEGRHHMKQENNPSRQRVDNGTHNFLGGAIQKQKVANRTHHLLSGEIQRKNTAKRIKNKTHNLLGPAQNAKLLAEGTHPTKNKATCLCCKQTVNLMVFGRRHGSKCKDNTVNIS
jgi:hypothetical protein